VYFDNDRFDSAIDAFEEYLVRHPTGEDVPRAQYYIALSYRYKGDYSTALTRLDEIARAYPSGNIAGDALWQSGRIAELQSRFDEAIARFSRIAREYPNSEYAQEAIFRKGLCEYKLADYTEARSSWGLAIGDAAPNASNGNANRLRFWLGKLNLLQGEQGAAQGYLEESARGDDFYAAKASVLLKGLPSFMRAQGAGAVLPRVELAADLAQERFEFERWLSTWSGRPGYSFDESRLLLRGDPGFRRAEELIRVGSWNEARDEFVELRERYARDPAALYELAMFFRENGIYYPSISTALDIVSLSPGGSLESVPIFLQKLVYPLYYTELLESEAQRYGIDPLLLAALIRQESVFDRNAASSANAKGLAQVVPSTGRGIARQLGIESFEDDDLYKPYVSVAFGAWYLSSQIKTFDNGLHALAAYNAGGSNVGKWITDRTRADDDLFVEEITFSETQTYVKNVYNQYQHYKRLYDR
jgi:soluble lytic murein transglycosylase